MTGLQIELLRKGLRDGRGLTRKEFAKKLDVTETTVYRWETERSEPHQVFINEMKKMG